jgi:hypothetical protein
MQGSEIFPAFQDQRHSAHDITVKSPKHDSTASKVCKITGANDAYFAGSAVDFLSFKDAVY